MMQRFFAGLTALYALWTAVPTAQADQVETTAPWTRVQGELVLARGQLAFAPCGEPAAIALDHSPTGELPGLIRARHDGREGAVFIEVISRRAAGGEWELGHVSRVYRHGERCLNRMSDYVWAGRDRAGQWTLEVTPWRVMLRERGREIPWSFPYRPFESLGEGKYQLSATSDAGAINIVLDYAACAIADERTDFTVEITLAGRRLQGCARNGTPPSPR